MRRKAVILLGPTIVKIATPCTSTTFMTRNYQINPRHLSTIPDFSLIRTKFADFGHPG